MASINVGESDFVAVADAAHRAKAAGDITAADQLDKLARKINAALSRVKVGRIPGEGRRIPLRWQDVPSVFSDGK